MKAGQVLTYLIIFLALGFFIMLTKSSSRPSRKKPAKPARRYTTRISPKWPGLDIKTRNGGFKLIKDTPDSWRMLEPMNTPADKWLIELVIRRLLTGQMERVFQEPVRKHRGIRID